jgi:hypothetical protein
MNNKPLVQTYKNFSNLRFGDRFHYRGEVATFDRWGVREDTVCGMWYRQAHVVNGDGEVVTWWVSQGMAGTVENTLSTF